MPLPVITSPHRNRVIRSSMVDSLVGMGLLGKRPRVLRGESQGRPWEERGELEPLGRRLLFDPLGMADTHFGWDESWDGRIITCFNVDRPGREHGQHRHVAAAAAAAHGPEQEGQGRHVPGADMTVARQCQLSLREEGIEHVDR